jgi:hypothetical protein
MSINTAVRAKIYTYEEKARDMDTLLCSIINEINYHRREGSIDTDQVREKRKRQAVYQAQRQAYIQAASDFDEILDHLGEEK